MAFVKIFSSWTAKISNKHELQNFGIWYCRQSATSLSPSPTYSTYYYLSIRHKPFPVLNLLNLLLPINPLQAFPRPQPTQLTVTYQSATILSPSSTYSTYYYLSIRYKPFPVLNLLNLLLPINPPQAIPRPQPTQLIITYQSATSHSPSSTYSTYYYLSIRHKPFPVLNLLNLLLPINPPQAIPRPQPTQLIITYQSATSHSPSSTYSTYYYLSIRYKPFPVPNLLNLLLPINPPQAIPRPQPTQLIITYQSATSHSPSSTYSTYYYLSIRHKPFPVLNLLNLLLPINPLQAFPRPQPTQLIITYQSATSLSPSSTYSTSYDISS